MHCLMNRRDLEADWQEDRAQDLQWELGLYSSGSASPPLPDIPEPIAVAIGDG